MKRNTGFFVIVTAILLVFSAVLAGSIYAIAKDYGASKVYSTESRASGDGDLDNIFGDPDAPPAQKKLQKKFRSMYEISNDGKSLTVISNDYLKAFWQSNYEKEVIHSLSIDEVNFIIQDSVRIYEKYDTIVLPSFVPASSDMQAAERFPCIAETRTINTRAAREHLDYDDVSDDIFDIIMYRLTALSSPNAFYNGLDPLQFVFGEDCVYDSITAQYYNFYTYGDFYIPGYSSLNEREDIFNAIVGLYDNVAPDDLPDLFQILPSCIALLRSSYKPVSDYSISINTEFPTGEMHKKYGVFCTTTPGGFNDDGGPFFRLNPYNGFTLASDTHCTTGFSGISERRNGRLVMRSQSEEQPQYKYVFYYTNDGYKYSKGESEPKPGLDFDDGTIFYFGER